MRTSNVLNLMSLILFTKSSNRPGVATIMFAPCSRYDLTSSVTSVPPINNNNPKLVSSVNIFATSEICSASSLNTN